MTVANRTVAPPKARPASTAGSAAISRNSPRARCRRCCAPARSAWTASAWRRQYPPRRRPGGAHPAAARGPGAVAEGAGRRPERDAAALERLVLHRDRSVIVLDKPQGLAVQGGPGIAKHLDGMLDALHFAAEERPRLVHRLDRDTSGVLVLARTAGRRMPWPPPSAAATSQKTYWAIVVGEPHAAGRAHRPRAGQGRRAARRAHPCRRQLAEGARAPSPLSASSTRAEAPRRLAGTEAAHRAHPPAARALRRGAGTARSSATASMAAAAAHLDGFGDRTLHLHARALRLPHPGGGFARTRRPAAAAHEGDLHLPRLRQAAHTGLPPGSLRSRRSAS